MARVSRFGVGSDPCKAVGCQDSGRFDSFPWEMCWDLLALSYTFLRLVLLMFERSATPCLHLLGASQIPDGRRSTLRVGGDSDLMFKEAPGP